MTPTDPVDPCEDIEFRNMDVEEGGTIVWADIENGSPFSIEVYEAYLDWPVPTASNFHYKFDLSGSLIWDVGNPFPPTMTGPLYMGNRIIGAGDTKTLVAVFDIVEPGFYHIGVSFTNGCWIEGWP